MCHMASLLMASLLPTNTENEKANTNNDFDLCTTNASPHLIYGCVVGPDGQISAPHRAASGAPPYWWLLTSNC